MAIAPQILVINSNIYQEVHVMAITVIYIQINPGLIRNSSIYLGAKFWNILPNHLRTLDDVKLFSKQYKQQLLNSIQTDNNYKLENAFDYFYKVKQSESAVIETSSIANTLMTILEPARRARQSNTSLPN